MRNNLHFLQQKLHNKVAVTNKQTFAKLTTVGCGGEIKLTAYPTTVKQMLYCVKWAQKLGVKWLVLGRGSNVLASDSPFDGMVICTCKLNKTFRLGTTVWCQCGTNTAVLAKYLASNGLGGGEFLYCLPATIGGATAMNAGCFGQEISQIVKRVVVLINGKIKVFSNKDCCFSKRKSVFQLRNAVVLWVQLQLQPTDASKVASLCKRMYQKKADTQPLGQKTFGSAFFNQSGTASQLVDKAGLKNYQIGGAKISNKHAGFVINIDKSTSFDIYLLLQHVKKEVFRQFGENLCVEVQIVGFTEETNDLGRLPHSHDK